MRENEAINQFTKELERIGFPKESIVQEYAVKNAILQGRIDIAIVDRVTNKVLAIFEVKVVREEMRKSLLPSAKNQLIKYKDILCDTQIPAYIVLATSDNCFEIYMFRTGTDVNEEKDDLLKITINDIIPYVSLSAGSRSNAKEAISSEIKKETDKFRVVCWSFAACSLLAAILDNFHIISISTTQLTLFGVAIALIIIPFSNKLKILGVEFERLTDEKKNT